MKIHIFALFTILFTLLFFSSFLFSACTSYVDTFTVRTLDSKLRPLPGALVWATYDRGVTFGNIYFTTPPRASDSEGKLLMKISNGGTPTRQLDCNIKLEGSAGWTSARTDIVALQHSSEVWLVFQEVYPVDFVVHDQLGSKIQNATVTLLNTTKLTSNDGIVRFYAKAGTYDYLVSYKDAKQAGRLIINDDLTADVVLAKHSVTIDVVDDSGAHLPVKLTIGNQTFDLPEGTFQNSNIFGSGIPYLVDYNGVFKEDVLTPSVKPQIRIVYDLRAPVFGSVSTSSENGRVKMSLPITDLGEFASGIDPATLRVSYRFERPESQWANAVAYTAGRGIYSADFPQIPQNSIVLFRADVKDNAGNKATLEGRFSTHASINSSPINDGNNVTNLPKTQSEQQGIPLLYTLIGIILLILVVYLVIRIKSKANVGGQ